MAGAADDQRGTVQDESTASAAAIAIARRSFRIKRGQAARGESGRPRRARWRRARRGARARANQPRRRAATRGDENRERRQQEDRQMAGKRCGDNGGRSPRYAETDPRGQAPAGPRRSRINGRETAEPAQATAGDQARTHRGGGRQQNRRAVRREIESADQAEQSRSARRRSAAGNLEGVRSRKPDGRAHTDGGRTRRLSPRSGSTAGV